MAHFGHMVSPVWARCDCDDTEVGTPCPCSLRMAAAVGARGRQPGRHSRHPALQRYRWRHLCVFVAACSVSQHLLFSRSTKRSSCGQVSLCASGVGTGDDSTRGVFGLGGRSDDEVHAEGGSSLTQTAVEPEQQAAAGTETSEGERKAQVRWPSHRSTHNELTLPALEDIIAGALVGAVTGAVAGAGSGAALGGADGIAGAAGGAAAGAALGGASGAAAGAVMASINPDVTAAGIGAAGVGAAAGVSAVHNAGRGRSHAHSESDVSVHTDQTSPTAWSQHAPARRLQETEVPVPEVPQKPDRTGEAGALNPQPALRERDPPGLMPTMLPDESEGVPGSDQQAGQAADTASPLDESVRDSGEMAAHFKQSSIRRASDMLIAEMDSRSMEVVAKGVDHLGSILARLQHVQEASATAIAKATEDAVQRARHATSRYKSRSGRVSEEHHTNDD
eukprot:TRINITY_DN63385_c0_g1_i1.p1 TRINITY_DN63385_c0_g1~~TRINITY_DN63385_c0_g1_i1.p1  ORF type:complete len:449 (-),score=81.94 TRINITY_DN63385_c0_g1_i1:88-1434(-)